MRLCFAGRSVLCLGGIAAVLVSGAAACFPPTFLPKPGMVHTAARQPRQADLQAQLSYRSISGITGNFAVDPYVTAKLSVPVELVVGWTPEESWVNNERDWALSARAGLRYRLTSYLAVGVGAGPSVLLGPQGRWTDADRLGASLDGEVVLGRRWGRFALVFGTRFGGLFFPNNPEWQQSQRYGYLLLEVVLAGYVTRYLAIAGSLHGVLGGPGVIEYSSEVGGSAGASLGVLILL